MPQTLEKFAADCHRILKAEPGPAGRQKVCALLQEVLKDEAFVAKYVGEGTPERKVIYEDPELGFCICGHVYEKPAHGSPHDHGSSWAIYGVALGDTEMSDWRIVKKGDGTSPTLVERERTYLMKPGDSHLYDVGAVHSPKRDTITKLVRIEGANLDRVVSPYTSTQSGLASASTGSRPARMPATCHGESINLLNSHHPSEHYTA